MEGSGPAAGFWGLMHAKNFMLYTAHNTQHANTPTCMQIKHPLILCTHLQAVLEDSSIHCVVMQGAGGKAYCAGGDIRGTYDV